MRADAQHCSEAHWDSATCCQTWGKWRSSRIFREPSATRQSPTVIFASTSCETAGYGGFLLLTVPIALAVSYMPESSRNVGALSTHCSKRCWPRLHVSPRVWQWRDASLQCTRLPTSHIVLSQ